ncbi:MAG TPA: NUMOD4 domain-containing protein [Allosphingosinicella sp.]
MSASATEETEVWVPAPEFEGRYEVSNLGRVRSLARVEQSAKGKRVVKGGLLTPSKNGDGYLQVCLRIDGKVRMTGLHRLVCRAFHGPPNILQNEAAHLDGSRTNARASNLKWVSKRENHFHKRLHGTLPFGEKHPRAKLTEVTARLALEGLATGLTCKEVGALLGVSSSAIEDIKKRKNWRHLQGPPAAYAPRSTGSGQRGEKNHGAKLTEKQASIIRDRAKEGETCRALAKEFGVGHACINRIARGQSYGRRQQHMNDRAHTDFALDAKPAAAVGEPKSILTRGRRKAGSQPPP